VPNPSSIRPFSRVSTAQPQGSGQPGSADTQPGIPRLCRS
jgi:hypothetical protein